MAEFGEQNMLLFEQALRSNDDSLLDYIIQRIYTQPNRQEIIENHISRLSTNLLTGFLRSFTQNIQKNPQNLEKVLPWLETLIEHQSSNISSSPECSRQLQELEITLSHRTEQLGLFLEAAAQTSLISQEKDGAGIGLEINENNAQIIKETDI